MPVMWRIVVTSSILFFGLTKPSITWAQDLGAQQKAALKEIRATAAEICYTVEQKGQQTDSEVSGKVQAKLDGVLAKVANLGIEAGGQRGAKEYQGVLQSELASALKDAASCRKDVFDKLVEKMLPTLPREGPNELLTPPLKQNNPTSAAHPVINRPEQLERARLPPEDMPAIPRPTSPHETCARRPLSNGSVVYCASSVLPPQFGNFYGVQNLFGATSNAWVAGSQGFAIGEWILVEFGETRLITSITLANGYQKNSDLFYKNSRVKELEVLASSGYTKQFTLEDRLGTQQLLFNHRIQAKWIALIIRDVFPGNKYTDTAISKLDVHSASN